MTRLSYNPSWAFNLYHRRSVMHNNIGEFLVASGCHEAIAYSSLGRQVIVKPWNHDVGVPNGALSPEQFGRRYTFRNEGFHDGTDAAQAGIDQALFTAGAVIEGHDIPTQHAIEIQTLARQASNPFGLEGNSSYLVSIQDLLDLEYVKDPNEQKPVWLTIYPRLAGQGSTPPADQGNPPTGQVSGLVPGKPIKLPLPVPGGALTVLSDQEAAMRCGAFFATSWPSLRKALQEAGGNVNGNMRHAIFNAFNPLILAAAKAGFLGEDGALQDEGDE